MEKEGVGFLQIIIATFLYGWVAILVRLGETFGIYNLTFFRILIATISLGLFFLFSRSKLISLKYERGKMILFGFLHGAIILGYFLALSFLPIASVVLLFSTYPIWMVIFSYFILKEKISKKALLALLIAFAGVIILISPTGFSLNSNTLIGSLSVLIAGSFAGLVYVLSKTFKKYDKVSLTFWQNLIAIPFVFPLIFISLPVFTIKNSIIVLLLGSLFTAVPFVLVFKGLQKIKAHKGGVVMLLEILTPIILALIIFKEIPSFNALIGGILILFGAYIVITSKN